MTTTAAASVSVGVVAPHGMHVTQKSHKTQVRDKPKHSRHAAGSTSMHARKQGGGRGNWGRAGDEATAAAEDWGYDGPFDPRDPCYDPEYAERIGAPTVLTRRGSDSTSSNSATSPSNSAAAAAAAAGGGGGSGAAGMVRRKSVNGEEKEVDPFHDYDVDDERHPCHRQIV